MTILLSVWIFTFHALTVCEEELGIILVAVLCFLEDDQEVTELGSAGEMFVVVGVDDGILGVVLVVAHNPLEVVVLVVAEGHHQQEEAPSQLPAHHVCINYIQQPTQTLPFVFHIIPINSPPRPPCIC